MRRNRITDYFDRDTIIDGARLLRCRLVRKRGLIIGYHSIRDEAHDPWRLCVSPENFREQIAVLKQFARVLTLGEFVALGRQGRLPARSVAITFDDGYLDNLEVALPTLERAGLPATIFMTTGYFGKEFWWDKLIRLIWSIDDLAAVSHRFESTALEWCRHITPFTPSDLARQLGEALMTASPDERADLLAELAQILDPEGADSPRSVAVTKSQAKRLAAHPLIDIGGHTVSHPMLSRVSPAEQRSEINENRRALAEITGQPVEGFAFPHGAISDTATSSVRDAGFRYACSGDTDIVWRRSDPFALPRLWAANYGGDVLRTKLNRWL